MAYETEIILKQIFLSLLLAETIEEGRDYVAQLLKKEDVAAAKEIAARHKKEQK